MLTSLKWFRTRGQPGATRRGIAVMVGLLLLGRVIAAEPSDTLDEARPISLSAQSLGEALRSLAKQTNLQILFGADVVAGLRASSVAATLTPRAVLDELLRDTRLAAYEQAPGVVVIRRVLDKSVNTAIAAVLAHKMSDALRGEGTSLEEVTVTAERRLERLQEVPISVTVFTQAAMDAQGMHRIEDIARLTPGVTFVYGTNYNSESSRIAIRGIDSIAGASTTGIYVDDTPIQSRHLSFGTFNAYPALFDIDRVEVLRGPQGTLFGSGSEGGTVRFIMPEPVIDQQSAYVRSEAALTRRGDPTSELGLAAGGALVDGELGFRASASYRYDGGYVDRIDWHTQKVVDRDSNASTTKTARVALKWVVNDALAIVPSLYYQSRHVDDTSAWWAIRPGAADPTNGQFATAFRNGNALANPSTDTFTLSALKVDSQLGAVRLVSNTSYYQRDESAISDYTEYDRGVFLADPFPLQGVYASTFWADLQRNWTQEVRLESTDAASRLAWTGGVFFQRAYESTIETVFDPALVTELGFPVYAGGYLYYQEPFDALDTQLAVFGQADVRVAERFKVTLGLRYADTAFLGHAYYAGPVVGPPVSSTGRLTEHPLTPKFGFNYQIDPDKLLYATVAKGYRIGGANPAVGQFCYGGPESALGSIGLSRIPPNYRSDSVWSYEIGSKNSFAERHVQLNASAYLISWRNIQQNVPLSACGFQFIANLGEAQSRGFDLEALIKVNEAVSLGATLGVTDAFYTQTVRLTPAALSIVQDGDHLAGSPWTFVLYGETNFSILDRDGYVRTDFQYGAKQSAGVPNQNVLNGSYDLGSTGVPAQSSTSVRAGLKWDGFDLSLFAQNIFDTQPRLTVNQDVGSPSGGTPLLYVISWRPRTVGLTLTYRFRH